MSDDQPHAPSHGQASSPAISSAPPAHPLDYADPRKDSSGTEAVVHGATVGLFGAVGGVTMCAMIGAWIDTRMNPNAFLAGLGGLIIGVGVAGVLIVVIANASFIIGRRRNWPYLRGVALGLTIAFGVGGIALGLCAINL